MTALPADCDSSDSLPHSSRTHVYREFHVKPSLPSPSVPQTAPDLRGHHMNTATLTSISEHRSPLYGTVYGLICSCDRCGRSNNCTAPSHRRYAVTTQVTER